MTDNAKLIEEANRFADIASADGGFMHILRNPQAADLFRRLAATLAAQEWQPIETAPRNGTPIIGYAPGLHAIVMFWGGPLESESGPVNAWHALHENEHPACWTDGVCWDSNENEEPSNHPTHWRPLPTPPQS